MTDVLIHRAVPGHRAGAIVPHERWMESHIGAGNIIVLPEDVQAVFIHVAAHRLAADIDAGDGRALAKAILHAVPVD